jgi:hypothetical protein
MVFLPVIKLRHLGAFARGDFLIGKLLKFRSVELSNA